VRGLLAAARFPSPVIKPGGAQLTVRRYQYREQERNRKFQPRCDTIGEPATWRDNGNSLNAEYGHVPATFGLESVNRK
jgi:hypothetical protein